MPAVQNGLEPRWNYVTFSLPRPAALRDEYIVTLVIEEPQRLPQRRSAVRTTHSEYVIVHPSLIIVCNCSNISPTKWHLTQGS